MQVVLKRDVKGLGKAHEVKKVSSGYARNYLIPQGLAAPATEKLVQQARRDQASAAEKLTRLQKRSQELAEKIAGTPLHFKVKAGETGRLYGSITGKDVAQALAKMIGVPFDKRQVMLEHSIRELGAHLVDLKLDGGVNAQITVIVEAEE
ncbi:MAG: 50S ribosomal protein L9 [Chloroflexota bacterium]|nr:50S ribosomal protein L9 [Chloroflexota bacterium]